MSFVTNARAATAAVNEAEKKKMPWLTWKYDPTKPTDRPWREWMLENQKTVARRGGL
ncbi:unnamed protein product [Alternaria alternata]